MNILRLKIDTREVNNIWFTSDAHFYHTNVIMFDKRPFLKDPNLGYPKMGYPNPDKSNLDTHMMNETIINNWNELVHPDDLVFYLGDFSWAGNRKSKELAHRLMGKIYFIMGNHDRYKKIKRLERFEGIYDYGELTIIDKPGKPDHICMSHYAPMVWNRHHHGSWYLHGHSHQKIKQFNPDYYKRRVEDVGCNGWDYKPVSYFELKKIMNKRSFKKVDHHE